MITVYIALGSNLGDRARNLREARERMEAPGPALRVTRASCVYETEPHGFKEQPWFLNQVLEAETTLAPEALLARLLEIESEMGRQRSVPNGPRVIDLDVLLYGSAIIESTGLRIPHPRMNGRRFVLEPLAELAGDFRHPGEGRTIRELLADVQDQAVRRFVDRR